LYQVPKKGHIVKAYHHIEIIAEIGNNAAGDVELACRIIDAAAAAGADAVKFQVIHPDKLVCSTEAAYELLQRESFRDEDFIRLQQYCERLGIEFLATPFSLEGVQLLDKLGVERFKIASGDIIYSDLLREIGSCHKPVLLATGGSSDSEIEEALSWLSVAGSGPVTLLHCVACYPPPVEELNLQRIVRLHERFNLPVGFSDHSSGWTMALAAAALGATVIEKHFTIDHELPGVDNPISILPDELVQLVKSIRELSAAMVDRGDGPVACEEPFLTGGRRSPVAAHQLMAGEILQPADIAYLRPAQGVKPVFGEKYCGQTLARNVAAGEPLCAEMFKGGNS